MTAASVPKVKQLASKLLAKMISNNLGSTWLIVTSNKTFPPDLISLTKTTSFKTQKSISLLPPPPESLVKNKKKTRNYYITSLKFTNNSTNSHQKFKKSLMPLPASSTWKISFILRWKKQWTRSTGCRQETLRGKSKGRRGKWKEVKEKEIDKLKDINLLLKQLSSWEKI